MQGLFSVSAMIYKLMAYGANVEIFSSYFQPRSRARVPLIYINRIALVLGILSVSMVFLL